MLSRFSKSELVLIIATFVSSAVITVGLAWAIATFGSAKQLLLLIASPVLLLGFASGFALAERNSLGAWGSLVFFGLQIVTVQRQGNAFWPGYNAGLVIEVYRGSGFEILLGVSSLVFTLLAARVIRRAAKDRVRLPAQEATVLLPPNTTLERTRER